MEEWKWMGTPIWSHDGGICTGESYKSIVKLTFFKPLLNSEWVILGHVEHRNRELG